MATASGTIGARIGRYALFGAAAAAAVAIGVRYGRHQSPEIGAAAAATGRDEAATASQPDVARMIAQLEARLRAKPDDAEGWRMLGWSNFNLGRYAAAAKAYARLAALTPNDATAWSALGEALVYARGAGVDADAAHAFDRAVAIDPRDARARYFLAVRKDMAGNHKAAIDDWIAILKDAPADAPYAQSIRDLVTQVATREKIDITGRLPPTPVAPPPADAGAAVARDAIPGPSAQQMQDAARMSPSEQDAMARMMVDRLAARLAADPHDEAGWIRLMRARMVLGDKPAAVAAHAKADAAFAADPAARGRIDSAARALGGGS